VALCLFPGFQLHYFRFADPRFDSREARRGRFWIVLSITALFLAFLWYLSESSGEWAHEARRKQDDLCRIFWKVWGY
jgi:4-amino-4-deoxy-L-arabinose transferase-like glycosyltransferase